VRDAGTGALIWGKGNNSWGDVGRGMVSDIDPRYPGMEVWSPQGALYSATGVEINPVNPRHANTFVCHFAGWWDDDLQRELTQRGRLLKFNYQTNITERIGTVSDRTLTVADVLGDWREEIIGFVNGEIRVCTPVLLSSRRFRTLMHDPLYRLDVSFMTMGYAQIPNPSFYFGEGMKEPPVHDNYTPHGADTAFTIIPVRFDFGSRDGSLIKNGFREILALAGNGWLYTGELEDSRGDTADALLVDQITGLEPGIFQVPLEPGVYKVVVHAGNQQESGYTRTLAEDKPYLDLVTAAGKFKSDSFNITVEDGVLDLVFAGSPWRIAGIEIKYPDWALSSPRVNSDPTPVVYIDQRSGILHIESKEPVAYLGISNMKGQLCLTSNKRGIKEVDVSGFEPGIYIVRMYSDNKVSSRKLILSPPFLP